MAEKDFPHLPLVLRREGKYRHPANEIPRATEQEVENKLNRTSHSAKLSNSVTEIRDAWSVMDLERSADLPTLPAGKPLMLEVDPNIDFEAIRRTLELEIICEEDDGYVIVATEDLTLTRLLRVINLFSTESRGGGVAARVYDLSESSGDDRLRHVLTLPLYQRWGNIADDEEVWVDVGIACTGGEEPRISGQRKNETDAEYENRIRTARMDAYEAWDEAREVRMSEIVSFVEAYSGFVDNSTKEPDDDFPTEFTARLRLPGKGLRDFVFNYPYLFEVAEADVAQLPLSMPPGATRPTGPTEILPPPANAPAVCVIDSGIQENHRLLKPSIDATESKCFFGANPADVADHVKPSGHGTRVAGAVLYGDLIPEAPTFQAEFWIQNARILDSRNRLPVDRAVYDMLDDIIEHFRFGVRNTRLYNQSVATFGACRLRHMSAWAARIDSLSHRFDVLFIQSVGNVLPTATARIRLGVHEHLRAGRNYPNYLYEKSCRVANPSQSLQAISVGSVSEDVFRSPDWCSFADGRHRPSAFSRSGRGIFKSVKPDVVEVAGDYLQSSSGDITTPPEGRHLYPELVRCTLHSPGPAFDRDGVGTSFAAPKVTRIAARLQSLFPNASTLLYRALIAQSARWPDWAFRGKPAEMTDAIRHLGFGIPDMTRATSNTDFRVTMISKQPRYLGARQAHVYQIRIPEELRRPGKAGEVLIEVCLSYSASVRRTRRKRRGYLSTWLDWQTNYLGEDATTFLNRVLKSSGPAPNPARERFQWTVGERDNRGLIRNVSRSAGTLQKDWCIVQADELPPDFLVAVVGHQGHSVSPADTAKYHLTVTVDVLGEELQIYDAMQVELKSLATEVELEQAEAEVDEAEV